MANDSEPATTTAGSPGEPFPGPGGETEPILASRMSVGPAASELKSLAARWRARTENRSVWEASPEPYVELAERFLALGVASSAREVVQVAREFRATTPSGGSIPPWGNHPRLRLLHARAHSECHNPWAAEAILRGLHQEFVESPGGGTTDDAGLIEEILGNLGRTQKDLADRAELPAQRQSYWLAARGCYHEAWRRLRRPWSGINVATLAMLANERDLARSVAREVIEICVRDLSAKLRSETAAGECYWEYATLGEAELLLGHLERAADCFQQARLAGARRYGQLRSTRRQIRRLLTHFSLDPALLDEWLPFPRVVVFAGYMVDLPGRVPPRFPADRVAECGAVIRGWLEENHALLGFSSGACGGDLLFQEALFRLGGETCLVLPFGDAEFIGRSVARPGDPAASSWEERFQAACRQATLCLANSPSPFPHDTLDFEFTNEVLLGMGQLLAAEYETTLLGLCLWDGQSGGGPGGTADAVAGWQRAGIPIHRVTLQSAPQSPGGEPVVRVTQLDTSRAEPGGERTGWPEGDGIAVRALLFGDATGFSRLTNAQIPLFNEHFLGPIGELLRARYGEVNEVRNTWGDGLFLAFATVGDAGRCALEIADLVRERQARVWREVGLPEDLSIRIALHAGPVFATHDPVTLRATCCGAHVSRAARLEPSTPPGEVYASQTFAALAAVERGIGFRCDFVRQLDWAKDYGAYPTYVVRWTGR